MHVYTRDLTLIDALYVAEHMRDEDLACIQTYTPAESREVFGLTRFQMPGAAWTLVDHGEPVAIYGLAQPVPWIATAWLVCIRPLEGDSLKKLLRHISTIAPNATKAIHRIECATSPEWEAASRFAERIGFEPEGVRQRAGRDGQDLLTYVYQGRTCKSRKSLSTSTTADDPATSL